MRSPSRAHLVFVVGLGALTGGCDDSSRSPGPDGGGVDAGGGGVDAGVDSGGGPAFDAGVADSGGGLDSDGGPSPGGTCPVVDYSPCGGDLIGRWAFRDLCPEDPVAAAALCEHPYDDRAACVGVGNEAVCDGTQTGWLVFHEDGSIDIDTTLTLVATWGFSDDCLAAVSTGASAEERCAALGSDRLSCSYDGGCTCVGDPFVQTDTNVATYAVVGDEVTIGDDPPATYCIDGDLLTMDYYVFHPVSWRYWLLERDEQAVVGLPPPT